MLSFQACPSLTAGTYVAEEKGLSMSKLLLIEQTKNGDVRPFRTGSLAWIHEQPIFESFPDRLSMASSSFPSQNAQLSRHLRTPGGQRRHGLGLQPLGHHPAQRLRLPGRQRGGGLGLHQRDQQRPRAVRGGLGQRPAGRGGWHGWGASGVDHRAEPWLKKGVNYKTTNTQIPNTPSRNQGLVGDFHLFETIFEVFIRGMGL